MKKPALTIYCSFCSFLFRIHPHQHHSLFAVSRNDQNSQSDRRKKNKRKRTPFVITKNGQSTKHDGNETLSQTLHQELLLFQPFHRNEILRKIERLRKHKEFDQILYLLSEHSLHIDTELCNDVLSLLPSSEGCWMVGHSILDMMKRYELQPTADTCAVLFQLCSNIHEVISTKQKLEEEASPVVWDESVWESALFASSRNIDGIDKKVVWSTIDQFLQEMKAANITLSKMMYLPLLLIAQETKDIARALDLYDAMKHDRIKMSDALWGALLQVCASTANDEEALKIMMDMNEKEVMLNAQHCTSYLNALTRNDKMETAIDFLHYMANSPRSSSSSFGNIFVDLPDMICVRAVLRACAEKESYNTTLALFEDIRNGSLGPNVALDETCYNILISACLDTSEAKRLIREMNLSRRYRKGAIPPSKVSYTRAISVCRRAKDIDSATHFLKHAKDNGIAPDLHMYSAAIWVAAEAENIRCAKNVFLEMREKGISPSIITYNGLITACSRKGNVEAALDFYKAAMSSDVEANRPTYALLSSLLRQVKDTDTRIKYIETIIETIPGKEFDSQKLAPLLILAIETYASLGRMDDALELFECIQIPCEIGCLRSITCGCSLFPDYWSEAVAIIHSSDAVVGQSPAYIDPISLGYAMISCSKANQWEESLILFRLYGDWKTPNIALNSLISACGRNGRADMALEVLNEMYKPDLLSYRKAMIACNQAEHDERRRIAAHRSQLIDSQQFQWWECALSLLRRMKEDGLKPDMQTYSSAISACEAAGQWQRALSILQTAIQDSHDDSLNLYCFNAALAACEKGGAWVEALDLFERMKGMSAKGLSPNVITYGSLIQALENARQKEMAMSLYNDALRKGVIKPWRNTRDEKGNHLRAMDLHGFSAAMARTAVRNQIERMRQKASTEAFDDLIIIVGKGLRSDTEPVLKDTVEQVLFREYGLTSQTDGQNYGRLLVKAESIENMISRWNL